MGTMGHHVRVPSANLLTGLRVVLTPAFVAAVWRAPQAPGLGLVAGGLFVIIAATDLLDGRVARRHGNESNAGRMFDHVADIGFILCALSTYAFQLLTPWWVPAAAGGAFAFYAFDSWAHGGDGPPRLRGSRVGHVGGICNYALVGILVFNNTASLHLLTPDMLATLFWLVPLYSAASVLSRLLAWRPRRRFGAAGRPCVTLGGQKP